MLASVERTVLIASGLSLTERTRKVAELVRGASTRWEAGTRRLILEVVERLPLVV